MANISFYLLAILAGIILAVQAGINSQLRTVLGNPVLAALISFIAGSIVLLIYVLLFQRQSFSQLPNLHGMAWYKWTGGIIGAMYVTGVILVAPKIGAANTAGFIVAGQILFALFLDHFGLLGFTQHPLM
ncbi:DMT family transporter [Daejeonella oryzae]|uniref:DMT family transporter n=1 Tax=Daejeonella oryzae TaxID=1122943 RepID=UPI00041F848A|nr:DMT family transporter [Daejeonella oryzae]